MISRFYSIKSEKMINKGAIVSTIFAVVVAGGCYFLGSFGRLYASSENIAYGSNGIIYDSIIPAMLSNFPAAMIGIVIILVFAASISTLSSLVMASSSTLTLDFLKGHIIKRMDEKKQLLTIRILIVVFIAISSCIAIIQYKGGITFIAQLMGVSWGALAGSFLAPFLYGLYWKRASKAAVWCCFFFSTALMTLNIFFRSSFPALLQSPINAGAFAMIAGLIIVPVVSMLTKAPEKSAVENCFSCYEETVNVKVRDDLGGK
jgi:Na+/proline symporter